MKAVFLALTMLAVVATAQTCPCTITTSRDCPTIQLIATDPNTCQNQLVPCEPCFCNEAGTDTCPTDVVSAYQYTDAPLCELTDITVARCPTETATPTPAPPPGQVSLECVFDDRLPESDFPCVIEAGDLPAGGGITDITLSLDQEYNVTVFAICGAALGEGTLSFAIEHFVSSGAWGPNVAGPPPLGDRVIPDVSGTAEVDETDDCQGTGDDLPDTDRSASNFVDSRVANIGSSTPAFLALMNTNAGVTDTTVTFSFTVNTVVDGSLIGSGLSFAFSRIVFTFTFIY